MDMLLIISGIIVVALIAYRMSDVPNRKRDAGYKNSPYYKGAFAGTQYHFPNKEMRRKANRIFDDPKIQSVEDFNRALDAADVEYDTSHSYCTKGG